MPLNIWPIDKKANLRNLLFALPHLNAGRRRSYDCSYSQSIMSSLKRNSKYSATKRVFQEITAVLITPWLQITQLSPYNTIYMLTMPKHSGFDRRAQRTSLS